MNHYFIFCFNVANIRNSYIPGSCPEPSTIGLYLWRLFPKGTKSISTNYWGNEKETCRVPKFKVTFLFFLHICWGNKVNVKVTKNKQSHFNFRNSTYFSFSFPQQFVEMDLVLFGNKLHNYQLPRLCSSFVLKALRIYHQFLSS